MHNTENKSSIKLSERWVSLPRIVRQRFLELGGCVIAFIAVAFFWTTLTPRIATVCLIAWAFALIRVVVRLREEWR